jgi:predicted Rossmann fold flavoprotein
MNPTEVVIVGGGAAGLMCAIEAGRRGRRVLVLERAERCGKKILMSGGGRCNFTNLFVEPERYLAGNPHFHKSALARYTQWDFIALVEAHGIAWHEKELGQLFCDGSSKQIVAMLLAECERAGVRVEVNAEVERVERKEAGYALATTLGALECSALVIATGGLSIPKMGATGFAYRLARRFGHTVRDTRAGLVPFTLDADTLADYRDLKGVSLPVTAACNGQSFAAGLLFTHKGISGPAILQISSYWTPGEAVALDLLPETDAAAWLVQRKAERPDAELRTVLAERLPRRLAHRLAALAGRAGPLRPMRDRDLAGLGKRLNAWTLCPHATEGYRTAEVTLGGIATDELCSRTLASKRVPGLYFIGEAVDVTGHLGGFNFQWAWASGYAAGQVV